MAVRHNPSIERTAQAGFAHLRLPLMSNVRRRSFLMVKAAASINLTREEAIVLIEFLLRFCDEQRLSVEHQAEEKLLWNLGCVLEEQVPELLLPEWKSIR